MKSNYLAALALTFAMLLPIGASAGGFRVLEDGREVAASMLTLPTLPDGQLAIQGCGNCKRLTLTIARTARFYIGATEVSFADLKRHLASNPEVSITVVSPIRQNIVTSIRASDALAR
jgi:hypothetical protein